MKKAFLCLATALMAASGAMAQVVVKTGAGDLSLRLIGRTNLDYGRYFSHCDNYDYGFKMNDTRLGVLANFDEKWSAKIEVCYANKAISFRDLWVGYKINDKMSLTAGNHFQPFGAKILGLGYKFIEDAQADYAICPSRKVGLSYAFVTNPFMATAGIYSAGNVDAPAANQGYSAAAKLIGRPICKDSSVLHIGVAGMYTDNKSSETFKVIQPETFTGSKSLVAYTSDINNTININRAEAELIWILKRFYFETHYLTAFSNLIGDENFQTQGAYAQASFLLIGKKQNYNKRTGLAANASPKNLELLARVNMLNMDEFTTTTVKDVVNDEGEVVKENVSTLNPEQKEMDFTLGLNYFFNKNLNARLNYTVSKVEKGENEFTNNAIQARLQFSF